jgi:hypothetical protein
MWRSFIGLVYVISACRYEDSATEAQRRRESKECAIQIDHFVVLIDHRNDTPLI